jgi:hypothetical protein
MNRRLASIIVSSLAVGVAVAAYGAAPAAAEFVLTAKACGNGLPTLCYEGEAAKLFEFEGEEQVAGGLVSGTETLISATIGGNEIHAVCTIDELHGTFLQAVPLTTTVSLSGLQVTLSGCALLEPLAKLCTIPSVLKFALLTGTYAEESPVAKTKLAPAEGTTLVAIEFANHGAETCPAAVKGTNTLTGKQTCVNFEPTIDATEHELRCEPTGSELKLGESAAELLLEALLHLEHLIAEKWSYEGGTEVGGFSLSTIACETGLPSFCYENTESKKLFALEGEEPVLGGLIAAGETLFAEKFGTEEVHLACTATDFHGTAIQTKPLVEAGALHNVALTFSGCSVLEPLGKKCAVPAEIKTNALTGTLGEESPVAKTMLSVTVGTTWFEVAFVNNGAETCPITLRGTKKITGKVVCQNVEPEVAATEHEISCEPAGSELKFGENTCEFLMQVLVHFEHLTGEKWDISLS